MEHSILIYKDAICTKVRNRRIQLVKSNELSEEGEATYIIEFKRFLILDTVGSIPEHENSGRYFITRPHSKYAIMVNVMPISETAIYLLEGMLAKRGEIATYKEINII